MNKEIISIVELPYPPEIEEQQTTKKATIFGMWVVVILFATLAGGVLYQRGVRVNGVIEGVIYLVIFLAIIVVFFYSLKLQIVIHELGHMVAGLWRGRWLILLSFGQWRYEKIVNGYRWRKATAVRGVGGVAAMVLKIEKKRNSPKLDHIIYMAGGAFANIIVGILFFLITLKLNGLFKPPLYVLAVTGVLLGVLNLLPFRTKGWETDGLQIWRRLQGKCSETDDNSLYLSSAHLSGVLPRDWPIERLPSVGEIEGEGVSFSSKLSAYTLRLEYALDVEDESIAHEAAVWLAQSFEKMPDGLQQQIAFLIAYYSTHMLENEGLALAWRKWCEGGLINLEPRLHGLDAEIAYLQCNIEKVKFHIKKGRELLPELFTQAESDEMERMLQALEQKTATE